MKLYVYSKTGGCTLHTKVSVFAVNQSRPAGEPEEEGHLLTSSLESLAVPPARLAEEGEEAVAAPLRHKDARRGSLTSIGTE